MSHLNNCNILSDVQFDFHCKRSAELQLLRTVNDFVFNLNNKKQTDIILLDLSKAFDKVSHRCLKHKLEYYGIRHPGSAMDLFLFESENTMCCMQR